MKKILTLLLMVSVVAGMTLPAMATVDNSAWSSSNGGTNKMPIDNDLNAKNNAIYTVSVEVNNAPQENNIHDVLAASGNNVNGAVATFDANVKANDAKSGAATSGSATSDDAKSGNAGVKDVNIKSCCQKQGEDDSLIPILGGSKTNVEAETGDAKSIAETGDAYSGDAKNIAKANDNSNSASADDNHQKTGNVDNEVKQINIQKTITPIKIDNDQKVEQKVIIKDNYQDASSYPETIAKAKLHEEKKLDIDTGDITVDL